MNVGKYVIPPMHLVVTAVRVFPQEQGRRLLHTVLGRHARFEDRQTQCTRPILREWLLAVCFYTAVLGWRGRSSASVQTYETSMQ